MKIKIICSLPVEYLVIPISNYHSQTHVYIWASGICSQKDY